MGYLDNVADGNVPFSYFVHSEVNDVIRYLKIQCMSITSQYFYSILK